MTELGSCCMQNNPLPTKIQVELEVNSIVTQDLALKDQGTTWNTLRHIGVICRVCSSIPITLDCVWRVLWDLEVLNTIFLMIHSSRTLHSWDCLPPDTWCCRPITMDGDTGFMEFEYSDISNESFLESNERCTCFSFTDWFRVCVPDWRHESFTGISTLCAGTSSWWSAFGTRHSKRFIAVCYCWVWRKNQLGACKDSPAVMLLDSPFHFLLNEI